MKSHYVIQIQSRGIIAAVPSLEKVRETVAEFKRDFPEEVPTIHKFPGQLYYMDRNGRDVKA